MHVLCARWNVWLSLSALLLARLLFPAKQFLFMSIVRVDIVQWLQERRQAFFIIPNNDRFANSKHLSSFVCFRECSDTLFLLPGGRLGILRDRPCW